MADARSVIPDTNRDLLEQPIVAHLATRRPSGTLQSNPVWFEWDGTHLKVSQTTDPGNPYRYLEVRGEVEKVEPDDDRAFIEELSHRYMGGPYPYHQPNDKRVIVYIRPTGSSAMAA